ncbi:MAG: glycosyltransferase family A protein [Pseudomonadota bacterium]
MITRTKNRPVLLRRAAESVKRQSFRDLIWVVVNDGGEPEPVEVVTGSAQDGDPHILVMHHPVSLGMEAASNRGISACDSDYFVIHDDDDTWEPDFLERTVGFLSDNNEYGGVVTHSTKVIEEVDGDEVREIERWPNTPNLLAISIIEMARINRFPPISFLVKRSLFEQVGPFDEDMPVLGDWDFALRVLMVADIGVIQEPLALYHHRAKRADGGGAYGNTVVEALEVHRTQTTRYRNRKLREDVAAGSLGLGTILALGTITELREKTGGPHRPPGLIAFVAKAANSMKRLLLR